MEESIVSTKFSSYTQSGIVSKIFFTWIFKDLWKGFRGKLSKDDIHIPKNLKADNVVERLERKWSVEVYKGRCSLLRVLVEEFGANALFASLLNFGKYCFGTLTQIYCLGLLVDTFDPSKPDDFLFQRYISASTIVAVTLGIISFLPHSYFMAEVTGMKISTGCSSLVFQKILRISTAEMSRLSVGHLISVISNDVAKFDYMCRATLTRLLDPLIIVSYVVFLTFIIGTPALAAVAVIVVFLIINMFIGRLFKKMRKQRALATDQRIKFTAEMVSEVKAVKMLSWEDAYYKIIDKFRQLESKYLKKICILRTVGAVQTMISTQTAFFVVLVAIVLVGDEITPKKVFTSYAGFASLRAVVVILMGRAFEQLAYGLVSIERIRKMLLICEMNSKNQLINPNNDGNTVLKFESAWFQSDLLGNSPQESEQFRLDIGMHIPKLSMTVIAGPVGSGKSSLLLTMANELCMFSGGVILGGRISYLPQRPWLFPATIKQNILFGLPFDQTRYSNVISACAIDQDLAAFEKGDGTIVDDKGLTLSGGQKARICLARCLYRDCDIYLLDDPLSAVDVRVENHIYKNCFLEKKTDKTFVLVSHRLRNLTDDVNFAYMEKGRILNQGPYGDVKHQITSLSEHMATDENVDSVPEAVFEDVCLSSVPVTTTTNSQIRLDYETAEKPRQSSGNPYVIYFKRAINCCSGFGAILLVSTIGTLAQACSSYFDIAVTIWTNKYYQDSTLTTSSQSLMVEQLYYLGCILLAEIILFGICYGMFYLLCLKASKSLHRNMLKRVLRADMKFFDSNRTGEIINKFSKDLENLDDILPLMLVEASRCTWNCLGILVNVAYSNYITIGPMVICIIMCIVIAKMYSRSIKVIKHAEADARGPMYTYMNISIQGLAVIRAHDNQIRVSREFNWHQDNHTSAWFLMRAFVDWIGMATEVMASFITISVIVIVLTLPDTMTGSKIGLGISSMLLFGDLLEHGINQFIEADNQIISAKRIQSYAELPEEDERTLVSDKSLALPPNWPQRGAVVFKDVHLYYGSKSVLKSINFSINPGEKIGIVGRTGAGKSSIVTALFRMAPFTGSITIDDIDVQSVPMADYRKKLSVIPQTPVILAGSIRYNLDPSNEHSDEQLWNVLESVHLKGCIEKMGVGLQTEISHLSVGEKQLCSLARVILRNNMVIVLDEATSNVDNKIDQELQTIIKQRFKSSTMLIIAHRLETIMDTDRVMVLHNGEILEFDKPSTLLNNPSSIFKKMVSQTHGRM